MKVIVFVFCLLGLVSIIQCSNLRNPTEEVLPSKIDNSSGNSSNRISFLLILITTITITIRIV